MLKNDIFFIADKGKWVNYYRTELYEDENYQRIYRTWLSVIVNEIIPFIVVVTLNIMVIPT